LIVKYGILTPNFGPCGDPKTLIELAKETELAGWHGFFLWDHLQWPDMEPAADPWVALSAIATQTHSIHIGTLITPLPRRDIVKLARETITLDHLSDGRLILGVGLGAEFMPEYSAFGHETEMKSRGEMLDEGLDVLAALWSGNPVHHEGKHYRVVTDQAFAKPSGIPVWVGGVWPNKRPMRRAAKWDGVVPLGPNWSSNEIITAAELGELVKVVGQREGYDIVTIATNQQPVSVVQEYADSGCTWWVETSAPFGKTIDEMKEQIRRGPPR
jgi:alkanesulfonate monooxygenase SsuD/methylene tetrahydromethanopterin reductase-like flavin-dependent oxidoreductase (luciferase family)